MHKYYLSLLCLLFCWSKVQAQQEIRTSDQIFISGELAATKLVKQEDLKSYPSQIIPDLIITNHMGEERGELKNMKGIPILEILKDLEFSIESPRVLSEFYFTFIATDNYTVVYSWNELFNSPTGAHTFLVTESNGMQMEEMEDKILMICTTDFKTGRRHLKSLDRILVNRVK